MTKLEQLRTEKSLSRNELAKLSGVYLETIRSYELGKSPLEKGTPSIICRLAVALNVPISELVGDTDYLIFKGKIQVEIADTKRELEAMQKALDEATTRDLFK